MFRSKRPEKRNKTRKLPNSSDRRDCDKNNECKSLLNLRRKKVDFGTYN